MLQCDDDVVFIANLQKLLDYARADGGRHQMYYPSVVNNDVSAAFQAAGTSPYALLPVSGRLWRRMASSPYF